MYDLVASLDRDGARRAYVRAFAEMRDAGITTVGEFHYLHHAGEELDYAFDAVVLEAARRGAAPLPVRGARGVLGPDGPARSRA
jgi:hypothetical protein